MLQRHPLIFAAALLASLLLVSFAFWPSLHATFLLDDRPNLLPLKALVDNHHSFSAVVFGNQSGLLGRPVSLASFALDALSKGYTPESFRSTNILLHLICGLAALWFTGLCLEICGLPRHVAWLAAIGVATVWMLSPIQLSTVAYIVQRMTQLATLFTLAGLIFYVKSRLALERGDQQTGHGLLAICVFVCLPLAALSKESGLLLLLLLVPLEFMLLRPSGRIHTHTTINGLHLIIVGATLLVTILVIYSTLIQTHTGYQLRDYSAWERVLTQGRALWSYLITALVPDTIWIGVYHDDFPISRGLMQPATTLIALCAWLVVVGAALLSRRSALYPLGFGTLFFLLGHSMEASPLPLEPFFEHRNYLPMLGIYIGLAWTAWHVWHHARTTRLIRAALSALLVAWPALFAVQTHATAKTWSNTGLLLQLSETAHPDSFRLAVDLIDLYSRSNQLDESLQRIDKQIDRGAPKAGLTLQRIISFCNAGQSPSAEALRQLEQLRHLDRHAAYLMAAADQLISRVIEDECGGTLPKQDLFGALLGWLTALNTTAPSAVPYHDDARWMLNYHTARLAAHAGQWLPAVFLADQATRVQARAEAHLLLTQVLAAKACNDLALQALQRARELPGRELEVPLEIAEQAVIQSQASSQLPGESACDQAAGLIARQHASHEPQAPESNQQNP